jgi:hypothetical protein
MRWIFGSVPYYYGYLSEEVASKISPPHVQPSKVITAMTWAASHSELGLLTELLCYANKVNGFKEHVKRDLKEQLVVFYPLDRPDVDRYLERKGRFQEALKDKIHSSGWLETNSEDNELTMCVELCQEYIDYLREILKPYKLKLIGSPCLAQMC